MKTHIQKVIHCSIICSEKTPEYYLNVQIKDISWINYSTHTMQLLKKQWERYLCDMQIFPGWFLVEKKTLILFLSGKKIKVKSSWPGDFDFGGELLNKKFRFLSSYITVQINCSWSFWRNLSISSKLWNFCGYSSDYSYYPFDVCRFWNSNSCFILDKGVFPFVILATGLLILPNFSKNQLLIFSIVFLFST